VTSESRQLLLQLVAVQAESAPPDRAKALEDLSAVIERRPPFWLDVLRPDSLSGPEVTELLDAYGIEHSDPDRFLQEVDNAIRYASGYGERWEPWIRGGWGVKRALWSLTAPRCPHCGGGVSREATVCGHCDRPFPIRS
jgi:hypothetical protein